MVIKQWQSSAYPLISRYQAYGKYWLVLASSYYENGDYVKCLNAIESYESLNSRIFRKDYDFARTLRFAISAADEALDDKAYESTALHYIQLLMENAKDDDWALRYFAAQTYVDLYGKTQKSSYLQSAYSIAYDNVNNQLVKEQRMSNSTYLAPINDKDTPEGKTKEEKSQIKNYYKSLKETRKTELPPVSEPLLLNCELLFDLANELNKPEEERLDIDRILHSNSNGPLFLVKPLDAKYRYNDAPEVTTSDDIEIDYGGTAIILPAVYVTDQASITVHITEKESKNETVLKDWKVDKVERVSEDVSSFRVVYTSDSAKKYSWTPDAEISIDVVPIEGIETDTYHFDYITHGTKNAWYDYLKVWEGHKNNWYDYGKVWENSVVFERVK